MTVYLVSPSGSTTYSSSVLTSAERSAPAMEGWDCTWLSISSSEVRASPLKMPAATEPLSRRWRTIARVSTFWMPMMPWVSISSVRLRSARQLLTERDRSRITRPATQILSPRDSESSSFQPVFPICGAVATTI